MQRTKKHFNLKKFMSIIIVVIIVFSTIDSLLVKKVHAVSQSRNSDGNNIYSINENLYPGYAAALQTLKNSHPNWTFTLFYTDLEWVDVLLNETTANHTRSLVQGKSGEWLCTHQGCDGIPHDGSSWFGASQTAVAYYMDPRNFLTEDRIFQFETLSYVPSIHTLDGVEAVLRETFMSNRRICDYYNNPAYGEKTFAQTIMTAAQAANVSPYHLASRVKQEVGAGGSPSITGTLGGYEGYFNFYNIGAYSGADPVTNGLIYAKNAGWDTPEKSIIGGATWIANGYISIGQDSLYLQKWDVDSTNGLYGHQYMQNIQAPTSEASGIYSSYKAIFNNDLTNTSFNFVIPMYKNISRTISRYPSSSTYVSQNAQLADSTGWGVNIRQTPAGTSLGIKHAGYPFIRIELKAAKEAGETWDKIMLSDGTIAYIATQFVIERATGDEVSKKAYINSVTGLLNAPRTIGNGSTQILLLYQGQSVTIIEEGKYTFDGCVWTKVRLTDGTEGYIQSNYVTEGSFGEDVRITCDTELALRAGPGIGNSIIKYIDPGIIVTRIEKATEKTNGYYWDKVVTADGTVGYMAREKYSPSYALWLTPVNGTGEKLALNETDKNIKVIPSATFADIKEKYPQATLISGTENLGTGAKISIDDVEYVIIKLGDVNGDAKTNSGDYVLIKNHIMDQSKLEGIYYEAADVNGDTKKNSGDYVLIKNSIMNLGTITL